MLRSEIEQTASQSKKHVISNRQKEERKWMAYIHKNGRPAGKRSSGDHPRYGFKTGFSHLPSRPGQTGI